MKHHVNIIFLGLFLNLCYGTPTGPTTPTFSLSEERSFDGSPKINVVFANGKSDTMILTKFDNGEEEEPEEKIETEAEVEECRYLGHLENEPSACVAMAGCPGVEKVEFTIFSENVFDSPAYVWTEDGSVKLIEMENSNWVYREPILRDDNETYIPVIFEPNEDNDTYVPPIFEPMTVEDRGTTKYIGDKYCDDENNNPDFNFDGGDCCIEQYVDNGKGGNYCTECRCKTMELEVKVGFGDSFSSGWKAHTRDKYIKNAMLLAQPYFCHKSLGYRIKLSYSNNFKHYKGYKFRCNDKYEKAPYNYDYGIYQLKKVEDMVESELGGADLMVLLGYDYNDFKNDKFLGGTTGIASNNVVCQQHSGYTKDKWSLNEYSNKGPGGMAGTIAHEIGHNIGIKHDHDPAHGGKGNPCDCKGVMSYSSNCQSKWSNGRPVKWSTCSQEDFKKHYDSLKNNWCMTSKPIKKDGTGNFCP